MDLKIQKTLKLKHMNDDRQKSIYHLITLLPEDASEDEIIKVSQTLPSIYLEHLQPDESESDEESFDEDDDDFEKIFLKKAIKTISFLLLKEKDLLIANTKTKNRKLVQKALQALTKEAEKLYVWEEKEDTLESFKTALSDLYEVENPEDYFNKKTALVNEYIVKINKQVDDDVSKWKSILSQFRIQAQKIIESND